MFATDGAISPIITVTNAPGFEAASILDIELHCGSVELSNPQLHPATDTYLRGRAITELRGHDGTGGRTGPEDTAGPEKGRGERIGAMDRRSARKLARRGRARRERNRASGGQRKRERERNTWKLLLEAYESRSQGGFPPKDRSRLRVAINAIREHSRRLDNTCFAIVLSTYPPYTGRDHYGSP